MIPSASPIVARSDEFVIGSAAVRYLLASAYGIIMILVYGRLAYWWYYFGFEYGNVTFATAGLAAFVAAVPAIFLPHRIDNFMKFAAWILYFLMFLPCMIIPILQGFVATGAALALFLAVLAGSLILVLAARLPLRSLSPLRITGEAFWLIFLGVYFLLNVSVYISFGQSLSFAGVEDVYEQRFAAGAAFQGSLAVYVIAILSNAFNPFLIAAGLRKRSAPLVALGTAGQAFMYMTLAMRSTLLSPLLIFGVYMLFRQGRLPGSRLLLAFVCLAGFFMPFMYDYVPVRGYFDQLLTLIYLRTLYVSGAMLGVYAEFFQNHSWTYYSHSFVGRLFTEYPYGSLPLGQVIGQHLTGQTGGFDILEANASFLATDGVAAVGLVGIVLASLGASLLLALMTWFAGSADIRVIAASSIPFLMSLANTSVFTSFLTGGGAVLMVLLYFSAPALMPGAGKAGGAVAGAGVGAPQGPPQALDTVS